MGQQEGTLKSENIKRAREILEDVVGTPSFQEASRCDIYNCSFTLCAEPLENQMELPQFGLHSCIIVCG